ncbi:hypothetical protein N0V82_005136 [Gnomoniopsis sp. IMI 355080]|nr:hypothetical protein N0V82_005136 [Gnomoniopsis sp. IMI 355080]
MFSTARVAALLACATGCIAQSSSSTPTATTTTATFTTYTGTAESPVVSINQFGSIQGNRSSYINTTYNFKGIPFANSSQEYRWHHPGHVTKWYDLKETTSFGPACPQEGVDDWDEDCLTLNVWTPGNATFNDVYTGDDFTGTKPNANASAYPVYVWIYGGRFAGGAASDALYDGSGLAAKGVVVVSMNYRLGALGWLAHPELSANSTSGTSGNYGLVDQQASLHWVNENIANFGGDPSRITIGGQSAGAGSVIDHVYSTSLADDLFVQVIAESGVRAPRDPMTGSLAPSYRQLAKAEEQGSDYLTNTLNVSTITEARALDVTAFLSSGQLSDTIFEGTVFENNTAYTEPPLFRPVLDGYVLPASYDTILEAGNFTNAKILTGNNKDESGASVSPGYTVATYTAAMQEIFGSVGLAEEFFQLYSAGNTSDEANNASNTFFRDQSRTGTHLWANEYTAGCELAANCTVYNYYWTHAPPGQSNGAYHMSEINYAFNNLYATDSPWTADDYAIADKLSDYWVNFISTGNPNGGNLTNWPANANGTAQTMVLGDSWGVEDVASSEEKITFIEDFFSNFAAW